MQLNQNLYLRIVIPVVNELQISYSWYIDEVKFSFYTQAMVLNFRSGNHLAI